MNRILGVCALVLGVSVPVIAAETVRFAPIQPDQYSAQQKEFADLMKQPPRNGNVLNAPFKVYFRSPEFGLRALQMSDYLRWGTQFDPETDRTDHPVVGAPIVQRLYLACPLCAGDESGT